MLADANPSPMQSRFVKVSQLGDRSDCHGIRNPKALAARQQAGGSRWDERTVHHLRTGGAHNGRF
jgi:hypothetical protein